MQTERVIRADITVKAGVEEVWEAWTTAAGVKTFFAPDCNVVLQVDGPYEMLFNPEAEPGKRGGEGVYIRGRAGREEPFSCSTVSSIHAFSTAQ